MNVLLAGVIVFAAASPASRFSFLGNGMHTKADVIARAGEPTVEWDGYLEEGDVDPDIRPYVPGAVTEIADRAWARGHEVIEVEVLEYELGDFGDAALVVLREGVVLYAVIPPPASQTSRPAAEEMFGPAEITRDVRSRGPHRVETTLVRFPKIGVAFIEKNGVLTKKIVWRP
jgi:hypothetical protein